jgi:hypothetical protein
MLSSRHSPYQIEVIRPRITHQLRAFHGAHDEILSHVPEVIEDGLVIVDHGRRRDATEDHFAQLQ